MGQITPSVGLISGINTGQIINELISLDSQPVTTLQNRISAANAQSQAYQLLGSQLSTLQTLGQTLENPTAFDHSTATSSDQGILTATAGIAAAVGSYSFNVGSLVTSQQSISSGYASANSLVGAGTLTIKQGGGEANSQTTLAELNGGTGVNRGEFRITDGSGDSSIIDLSSAVTLDDVVNKINSSLGVSVHASISDDHLVLQDLSGQNKTNFSVADLGNGTAAADLGIVGSTGGTTITGSSINTISNTTPLSLLNDGRGIGAAANGTADFQVTTSDGSSTLVSLNGAQTVGDLLTAINTAGGSKFKAGIDASTNSITLTDTAGGGGNLSVVDVNNSTAGQDLGILGSTPGKTVHGSTLLASLDSVLVSSLNGGAGIPLGTVQITDRHGTTKDVDLSGAKSIQDILDTINASGLQVNASLNNAGDGIQLQDTSGDSGNLIVSDTGGGATAQALSINGTFDASQQIVSGGDLHTQYVSDSTLLSKYNGGKGVNLSSFTITNSKGASATVDLSQGTFSTIGDVLSAINAKSLGVTASINSTGDGILLTDTAGGAAALKVADVSGTTAADLNIAGAAAPASTTINGGFSKTVTVTATDTLTTLQAKIQALGFGATANIVNDGSGTNGFHLAFTSLNSGRAGRVVIDGGATSINTQTVVQAKDATVFYGDADSSQSLLITSSSNQVTGIIPGVTLQLQGTGTATLNVARDPSSITNNLQNFADIFNGLIDQINTLTQFDSTTNTAGLLLGDATVQNVQQELYTVVDSVVNGAGQFKLLADVGVTIGTGAKLTFDPTAFANAYAKDPTAVQNLFTQATTGLGTVIDKGLNTLVDPVNGSLTRQEATLTTQVQGFQDSINQLNAVLANQRNVLTEEFANMESVLAGLQSQQATLSSISSVSAPTTTKSSSSTSSSSSSG